MSTNTSTLLTGTATKSAPQTHTVAVGRGDHTFAPNLTIAEVGDIVHFEFYPANHSVVRAEYGYPCIPYEMIHVNDSGGFYSGWHALDTVQAQPPSYSIRVNDTLPIYLYCGAPDSCTGFGMVGAINPNTSQDLAYQRELALRSTFALTPGEPWPQESPASTKTSPSSVTATLVSGQGDGNSSDSVYGANGSTKQPGTLPAGIVVTISVVSFLVFVAIVVCIYWRIRRQRRLTPPHLPSKDLSITEQPVSRASLIGATLPGSVSTTVAVPPEYTRNDPWDGNSVPMDPSESMVAHQVGDTTPISPLHDVRGENSQSPPVEMDDNTVPSFDVHPLKRSRS